MVRACGSYPQCPGFDSLHRHWYTVVVRLIAQETGTEAEVYSKVGDGHYEGVSY